MSLPTSAVRKAWLKWKSMRLPWRKRFLAGLDLHGNTYWEFRDTLSPGRMRRIVHYPSNVQYSEVPSHITPAWHQWLRHTRVEAPTLEEQEQDLVRLRRIKLLAAQADQKWEAKGRLVDGPEKSQTRPALRTSDATLDRQPRPGEGTPETWTGTAGKTGETGIIGEDLRNETIYTKGPSQGSISGQRTTTNTAGSGQQLLDQEAERMRVDGGPGPKVYTNPGLSGLGKQATKEPVSSSTPKYDPWKKARGGPSEDWQPQAWNPGQVPRR